MRILSWLRRADSDSSSQDTEAQNANGFGPEQFRQEAQEARDFWSNEKLDFSPESLDQLDDIINDQWDKDRYSDACFGGDDVFTGMVLQFGSYFGETLIRNLGGEWRQADEDEPFSFWVVDIDGNVANVFHIVEDCFKEPSKLYHTFQILEEEST